MPAIGTSSDQYQHRDPALTTYRRNAAAPTLAQAITERSEDRRKAAAPERRQVEGRAVEQRRVEEPRSAARSADPRPTEPVTPQRVVHELYAPPSRLKREHDDRHTMITGGTLDVRA
jgi:hypothetical protein